MIGHQIKVSKNWNTETNQNSKRIGSGQKAFYSEAKRKLYA